MIDLRLPTGSPTTSTTRLPPSPDREIAILSYLILPSPPCLPPPPRAGVVLALFGNIAKRDSMLVELAQASIALHTTRLERRFADLQPQPFDLFPEDESPAPPPPTSRAPPPPQLLSGPPISTAGRCPPLPATPLRCGTFSDHLLCLFAVAMPTTPSGAPNINATTLPLRFAHDRACIARSGSIRAHVLASGADLLWRSPGSPGIPPGCHAAAEAMRDDTCGLREGCAVRTCALAGFPIEAARSGRRAAELSAELPWGVGSGEGWGAGRDAASNRPVAVAPPERDATAAAAAAAVAAVEEQPPAYIQEALRHDRNVLNGLPGEWPGV